MTLADRVVDASGGLLDKQFFGGISMLAEKIVDAERFVFSPETHAAIGQLARSEGRS